MTKLYYSPLKEDEVPVIKPLRDLVGLELVPKYWHPSSEDLIWIDVPEKPELARWIEYYFLDDWTIKRL